MKRKRLFALLLSGLMLTGNAISTKAVYESAEEIAFVIRPTIEKASSIYGYEESEEDATLYLIQDEMTEGETLHFSVYIEAETQQMDGIELLIETDSEKVTFNPDAFVSPTVANETQTYTLPDGTEFATKLKPYALGSVGTNGVYSANCWFSNDFSETQATFSVLWMLMPNASRGFLGGQSDLFSFIDLDVNLASDIEAGTYHIDFTDPSTSEKKINYVYFDVADHSNQEGSKNVDTIPTLKGCNICIGKKGDVDGDGEVSANDAAAVLIYAAASGSGEEARFTKNGSETEENFRCSLASLNGDSPTATDAASILIYAAIAGAGDTADWDSIINQN